MKKGQAGMALRLAHQMFGSHSRTKPPILILHGMFGSSNNWRSLGKKIAAETGAVVRESNSIVANNIHITYF